jgi:hypothetical protein
MLPKRKMNLNKRNHKAKMLLKNKMKNQRVKNLNMKSNQSKMLPKRKMSLKMRCINKINQ